MIYHGAPFGLAGQYKPAQHATNLDPRALVATGRLPPDQHTVSARAGCWRETAGEHAVRTAGCRGGGLSLLAAWGRDHHAQPPASEAREQL